MRRFQSSPALDRGKRLVEVAQSQLIDILHADDRKNIAYEAFFIALGVGFFPLVFWAVVEPDFGYPPEAGKGLEAIFSAFLSCDGSMFLSSSFQALKTFSRACLRETVA